VVPSLIGALRSPNARVPSAFTDKRLLFRLGPYGLPLSVEMYMWRVEARVAWGILSCQFVEGSNERDGVGVGKMHNIISGWSVLRAAD
jgi:hypothetical protein